MITNKPKDPNINIFPSSDHINNKGKENKPSISQPVFNRKITPTVQALRHRSSISQTLKTITATDQHKTCIKPQPNITTNTQPANNNIPSPFKPSQKTKRLPERKEESILTLSVSSLLASDDDEQESAIHTAAQLRNAEKNVLESIRRLSDKPSRPSASTQHSSTTATKSDFDPQNTRTPAASLKSHMGLDLSHPSVQYHLHQQELLMYAPETPSAAGGWCDSATPLITLKAAGDRPYSTVVCNNEEDPPATVLRNTTTTGCLHTVPEGGGSDKLGTALKLSNVVQREKSLPLRTPLKQQNMIRESKPTVTKREGTTHTGYTEQLGHMRSATVRKSEYNSSRSKCQSGGMYEDELNRAKVITQLRKPSISRSLTTPNERPKPPDKNAYEKRQPDVQGITVPPTAGPAALKTKRYCLSIWGRLVMSLISILIFILSIGWRLRWRLNRIESVVDIPSQTVLVSLPIFCDDMNSMGMCMKCPPRAVCVDGVAHCGEYSRLVPRRSIVKSIFGGETEWQCVSYHRELNVIMSSGLNNVINRLREIEVMNPCYAEPNGVPLGMFEDIFQLFDDQVLPVAMKMVRNVDESLREELLELFRRETLDEVRLKRLKLVRHNGAELSLASIATRDRFACRVRRHITTAPVVLIIIGLSMLCWRLNNQFRHWNRVRYAVKYIIAHTNVTQDGYGNGPSFEEIISALNMKDINSVERLRQSLIGLDDIIPTKFRQCPYITFFCHSKALTLQKNLPPPAG